MIFITLFALIIIFFGLFVTSYTMKKTTLRQVNDFLAVSSETQGYMQITVLGLNYEVNSDKITNKLNNLAAKVRKICFAGYECIKNEVLYVKKQIIERKE